MNLFKFLNYLGMDWQKVTAFDSYIFESIDYYRSFNRITKNNYRDYLSHIKALGLDYLTHEYNVSLEPDRPGKVFFFKSMHRPDYDKMYGRVMQSNPASHSEIIVFRANIGIRIGSCFRLLFGVLMTLSSTFDQWFKAYYIMLKILDYRSIIDQLHKFENKPEMVVTFADMQPMDNLISQYYNKLGINTVTLQHGLYVEYPNNTINQLNYKNVVSRNFLAWGSITKDLILKYNPDTEVHICGKPVDYYPLSNSQSQDFFSVFFDQEVFKEYNHQLLEMVKKIQISTGLSVNILLHPNNRRSDYKFDPHWKFGLEWSDSDFCIAHTTSMIYESLFMGIPCFRLVTDIDALRLPEHLEFTDVEELLTKINEVERIDIKEEGRKFIHCIDQESMMLYAKYFEEKLF